MRDVARRSGVSIATVSRVFNGGVVGTETRASVEQVARTLRYVPNRAARSLNTARTHTIGVVLPDLYGAFYSELLRGLDAAATGAGYHLLVTGSHAGIDELAASLQSMSGRVDGLVVMSPDADAGVLEANLPAQIPVVLFGAPEPGVASCGIDDAVGAAAMVRHLVGLGHRRIAHLAGPDGNRDAAERLRGYRDAMDAAGLPTDGLVLAGDFTEAAGHRAGEALAAAARSGSLLPDALFAGNDAMAIGAISALRAAGLHVPQDVAVAGFDDVPFAQYLQPALTSVHVPTVEMSRMAIAALLRDGGPRPEASTLPTQLVVRESCGAGVPVPGRTA